jgi:hypothetical protein
MAVIDVTNSIVQVAAESAGPYATISDVRSWDGTHGEESETRVRVFGRADPYVRAGDDTDEYSLSGLYNPDDTNGQNVLRDAKDNRTTVFLRVIPDGFDPETEDLAPGATGYTQECRVSEYGESGDADGDFVECDFAARGVGTRTPYTVPT